MSKSIRIAAVMAAFVALSCGRPGGHEPRRLLAAKKETVNLPPRPNLNVKPLAEKNADGSFTVAGFLRHAREMVGKPVTVKGIVQAVETCPVEQERCDTVPHLVLVDELTSQIRSAKAATVVDTERLALDVVRQEGRPSTNYLGHDHTVDHMKEAMYYSDFTGRTPKSYEDWYELAHEKVQAILRRGRENAAADPAIAERAKAVAARLSEDDHTWREGQDGWWREYVQDLT